MAVTAHRPRPRLRFTVVLLASLAVLETPARRRHHRAPGAGAPSRDDTRPRSRTRTASAVSSRIHDGVDAPARHLALVTPAQLAPYSLLTFSAGVANLALQRRIAAVTSSSVWPW